MKTDLVRAAGIEGEFRAIWGTGKKPFVPHTPEFRAIELDSNDVVCDIGAYIGTASIIAAQAGVREVRAYEPTPRTFPVLRENLAPYANAWAYEKAVVAGNEPTSTFFLSRGIGVANSVVPSTRKDPIIVDNISFDEATRGATVLKIDVEGAEYSYPLDELESARALQIDFHAVRGANWVAYAQAIIASLIQKGYTEVVTPNWERPRACAGLWVRHV